MRCASSLFIFTVRATTHICNRQTNRRRNSAEKPWCNVLRGGVGDDPCPEPQRADSKEHPNIRPLSQDAFDVRRVDGPLAANSPDDPTRENHEPHHPDQERQVGGLGGGLLADRPRCSPRSTRPRIQNRRPMMRARSRRGVISGMLESRRLVRRAREGTPPCPRWV